MMLRPRALTSVLSQSNTDGVHTTLLFRQDGTLLAHSGTTTDAGVASAIASNVWAAYDKAGRAALSEDRLEFLLLDCEQGRVAVLPVNKVLLALVADQEVGLGMLKVKGEAVAAYLGEALSIVGVC
jgi:predicted regulator of Ras-like GTPase activity (Roadblock/LC7/MglB family)